MKSFQPIKVTFTNGEQIRDTVDMFNLTTYLSGIDMSRVAGIEYGEAVDRGPAEFRPSGIQYTYSKSEGVYHMNIYDKDDRRVATCQYAPTKLQQAAVDLLQQTTYRFIDVQDDHDHLKHRLEGLDK
jgi:hypothetical protein